MSKPSEDAGCTDQVSYDDVSLDSQGAHLFFGEVDESSARDACEFILKSNMFELSEKPLTIIVNSCGGSTSDGFAVIDVMETSRRPIATVGLGLIASMGVLMVSAGIKGMRTMTRNSEVMAHQFAGYFEGKRHELIAQQTGYDQLERRFIRHFQRHSTMTERQIRDIVFSPSDRYLTPAECKRFGLVDRIVDHISPPIKSNLKPSARRSKT